jgi:uncharacterized membrane protein
VGHCAIIGVVSAHHHGAEVEISDSRAHRIVRWTVVGVAVLTVIGAVILRPTEDPHLLEGGPFDVEQADATITDVSTGPCAGTTESDGIDCVDLEIRITSGPTDGDTATFQQTVGQSGVDLDLGDRIVVARTPGAPEGAEYAFVDFQRKTPLLLLAAIFAVSVLLLGRLQGLRALAGAAVSVLVLVLYLLPALLEGTNPLALALVASSIIAFVALYVTHGVNDRSTVALLGTLASLALVGVLGFVFVEASQLTGLVGEETSILRITAGSIDFQGLLLAGIVIGSLGVLDDVTVTQVSAVWELRAADPDAGSRDVYRSAIRIGRDHIASTVNTLVLAYAGAALPLLLLFTQSTQPLSRVVSGEVIAVEVIRTLVGSIGLVASVPITTALAVLLVGRARTVPAAEPEPAPVAEAGSRAGWDEFGPTEDTF